MILRIVTNTTMIQMARADKRRRSYRLGDSVQVIILPMKARIFFHSLLPIALMLSGCEQPETTQKIAALEQRVKNQEEQNAALLSALAENEKRVNGQLSFLIREALQRTLQEKTAVIDPHSKGYSILDTGRGSLLISCDGPEPFLDGYRIKLRLGNPLYMRFSGFKLKFKFGQKPPTLPTKENVKDGDVAKALFETWPKENEAWKKSLKHAEESYTDDLLPGTWTNIETVLPQANAEEIAYIEVGIEADRISLTKP